MPRQCSHTRHISLLTETIETCHKRHFFFLYIKQAKVTVAHLAIIHTCLGNACMTPPLGPKPRTQKEKAWSPGWQPDTAFPFCCVSVYVCVCVCAVVLQQEGATPPGCVEYACSPHVCMHSAWVPLAALNWPHVWMWAHPTSSSKAGELTWPF